MLTVEQSNRFAFQIEIIKLACMDLDWSYATELVNGFANQAAKQETLAILNPMHPPASTELLRQQGEALKHLIDFVDALKKCDQLKIEIESQIAVREKITSMFL